MFFSLILTTKYRKGFRYCYNNIIILGDKNKDLLNPNMHNLKDVFALKFSPQYYF